MAETKIKIKIETETKMHNHIKLVSMLYRNKPDCQYMYYVY